jgi:hypothetical protein
VSRVNDVQIAVRLPADLLAEIDAFAVRISREIAVSRSDALRLLVKRGLGRGKRKK